MSCFLDVYMILMLSFHCKILVLMYRHFLYILFKWHTENLCFGVFLFNSRVELNIAVFFSQFGTRQMEKSCVLLIGILVLCCGAVGAEAAYMKYKDPKQPINVRIKDLMIRMSLEEKIGQMVQIDRTVASYEVMKNYSIGISIYQNWSLWWIYD